MSKFAGYMLKVGERNFPNEYIALETWSTKPNQRTDQDSYTDGNGELVRNILPHKRSIITFQTVDELHLNDKINMQSFFNRDSSIITFWNDDTNEYKTGKMYLVDPEFPIKRITDNDIIYGSIKIELIEY